MNLLSRSEEIVLLAIWKLQKDAYGVTIRSLVNDSTGYEWSVGAIYAPLHRLVKKGLVRTLKGEPIPARGGRHKIFYEVTPDGKNALHQIKRVHEAIWQDAPTLGLDES
ncbi:MAG: PadR family transcriptional regulator [Candidatus Aminicenantes bacterium]|nr:MAG: PadR family transcriptional regulator [Candidatus Aminicenantes bacterium]